MNWYRNHIVNYFPVTETPKIDTGQNLDKEALGIPAKLQSSDLEQTPEEHPHFEGYDHNLDMDRWELLQMRHWQKK